MSFVHLIKRNSEGEIAIAEMIKEQLVSQRIQQPIHEDSWIRVSSLGSVCEREEVLCARDGVDRVRIDDGDSVVNFAHGHAVHWLFQNKVLPDLGLLIGSWRCTYCGTQYGSRDEGMIPRPDRCFRCGAVAGERPREDGRPDLDVQDNAFVFVEEWLGNDEHKIGGSPDGQLILNFTPNYKKEDLTLIELKSVNDFNFSKIKNSPDYVHVIQTQIYLWLTGYPKAKILYFNKNEKGTKGMIEHNLDYDQECVDLVLAAIKRIRDGIANRTVPPRVMCANDECSRAMGCKVKRQCFSE